MSRPQKRIAILGVGGVGKTSFVNKLKTDRFDSKYIPTLGREVKQYRGYNLIDVAGQNMFQGTNDFHDLDGVILMFDWCMKYSLIRLEDWYNKIDRNVPIILCGNKNDIRNQKVTSQNVIDFIRNKENIFHLCAISVKKDPWAVLDEILDNF